MTLIEKSINDQISKISESIYLKPSTLGFLKAIETYQSLVSRGLIKPRENHVMTIEEALHVNIFEFYRCKD